MKLRKLLSWIPIILAVSAAAVLAFSYLHVKKTVVAKLSQKATDFLGQQVSIQDLSFDLPAVINLYDISVKNPEGFPSGELLRLKRLHIDLRLLPLLKGRFSLRNLVAFSPEVEIIKNAQNRFNIPEILLKSFSRESSSRTKFEIDLFEVDSGSFRFNGEDLFTFRDVNVTFRSLPSGAPVPMEIKGAVVYLGNAIQVEGSVAGKEKPPRMKLRVSSKNVSLSALGRYLSPYRIDTGRTGWDVELNLEGDPEESLRIRSQIQQVKGGEIFQFAPSPRKIRCQVDASLSPSRGSLAVHRGLLEAEGLSARFSGTWTGLRKDPAYELEMQISRLDLSKFNFGKEVKVGGILSSGNVRWRGTLKEPWQEASGSVQVKEGEVRTAQAAVESLQGTLEFSSSAGWKVRGDASARIAKAGSFLPSTLPTRNIQLRVDGIVDRSLDALRIQTGTLEAEGFSGRFNGRLSDLKKTRIYEIDVQVDRFDLSQFNLIKDFELSGIATSSLIRLRGDARTGMPEASGVLRLREGAIQNSQARVGKISADLDFSWAGEFRAKADAVGEIEGIAGYAADKPVEARVAGSVQGTPQQMSLVSSLSLSPLGVRLKEGPSLSLGKSLLQMEGSVREGSFSGRHSFHLDDIRYADHVIREVKGKLAIGFQGGKVQFSDIEIQSGEIGAKAAEATIRHAKPGGLYEIDLQDLNVTYRGDEVVLEKGEAHSTIRPEEKVRLADLRFSMGTLDLYGFPFHQIKGTGTLDERGFSLEILQGEVLGGDIGLSAQGRISEGPFPIKVKAIAQGVDLGAHPEVLEKFLKPPFLLRGKIERLRCDGTLQTRDTLEGQILLEARQISLADQKAKRNIIKDASLDATMDCKGKDLLLQAGAKIGDISADLSGRIIGFLEEGRKARVKVSLPETDLIKLRETFWDIFPDSLLYTGLEGSLSAALSMDVGDHDGFLEGLVRMNRCTLRGENGEYVIGPIQGALPVRYSRMVQEEGALNLPSFEKSRFDALVRAYMEGPPEAGADTITIGAFQYGFPLLENIRLHVKAGDNVLNIVRFDANIFGGSLYGTAVLNFARGLNYRGGLLIKGLSLTGLCDRIKPIQGFISGRVNGVGAFKGSGAGLRGMMGRTELWADPQGDEGMRISREFLEKIGGPSAGFYLGERRYDTGVMDVYFMDDYLIFKELELSNRNFLGITDLSVKVAPLSNRITLDHLLWTITEAAARAKEKK